MDQLNDCCDRQTDWLLTYTECRTADSSGSNPRPDSGKPRGCCCPVLGGSLGIEPQAACLDLCGSHSTSTGWSVWKYSSLPGRSLPVHFPELPEVHQMPLRVKHISCLPELPEVHRRGKILTLSLPQPVKFPGCMMHGRACKQYTFRSYNIYFQCCTFWWRSFHMPVSRRRQKRLTGFKLCISIGCFQVTSWQWRG